MHVLAKAVIFALIGQLLLVPNLCDVSGLDQVAEQVTDQVSDQAIIDQSTHNCCPQSNTGGSQTSLNSSCDCPDGLSSVLLTNIVYLPAPVVDSRVTLYLEQLITTINERLLRPPIQV